MITCLTCGALTPCLCEDSPIYDTPEYWMRLGKSLRPEREVRIDGSLHFEGDCCQDRKCPTCGAAEHFQGIYGGYITMCEKCPEDAPEWQPAGTYCLDCECTREMCARRNCASEM